MRGFLRVTVVQEEKIKTRKTLFFFLVLVQMFRFKKKGKKIPNRKSWKMNLSTTVCIIVFFRTLYSYNLQRGRKRMTIGMAEKNVSESWLREYSGLLMFKYASDTPEQALARPIRLRCIVWYICILFMQKKV